MLQEAFGDKTMSQSKTLKLSRQSLEPIQWVLREFPARI